ncbi:hypothetical protein COO60DRAFT_1461027 [Scenedesmus sp. NREL 46B-D3]|nr:hypothetical protein COO60DRAFT_1461027 [Scenedesmus sp. NREL 46B-D3]
MLVPAAGAACSCTGQVLLNIDRVLQVNTWFATLTASCCKMLSLKNCALAGLLLLCVVLQAQAQGQAAAAPRTDAATLTLQFDNRFVLQAACLVCKQPLHVLCCTTARLLCPQVTVVSGLDQSGLLGTSSVVSFRAVGPTTNGKTVLQNCKDNTGSRWLGLRDSVAKDEVKKATDTWWPNDSVEIDRAECAA